MKAPAEWQAFTIKVSDSSGRLMMEVKNKDRVDVSSLQPGLFFIEVLNDKGTSTTRKLILE